MIDKGFFTLPVTLKRHRLEALGLPAGGPMDSVRCALANRLAGNPDDAAALEAALVLPGLRFIKACAFAVVGGVDGIILRRRGLELAFQSGRTVYAEAGDELAPRPIGRGMRAYIAFSGGIRLRGLRPKRVENGDLLELFDGTAPRPMELAFDPAPAPEGDACLRVIEGTQLDHFSAEGIDTFFGSEFVYTPQSDRMGIRLSGKPVAFREGRDGNVISEGMIPGDVQITADGQPIIMTADCQTVGGYAKIAHVILAELPTAAQLRPGSRLGFKAVSVADAHIALRRLVLLMERAVVPAGEAHVRT